MTISSHFSLSVYVTNVEMLHALRGRFSIVQYISNKPMRDDTDIYTLCDYKTFCTFNFENYWEKQVSGPHPKSNQTENIGKRLVVPTNKSKRNVTTDNFYTSTDLFRLFPNKNTQFA